MSENLQSFGGSWTKEKLRLLEKYLGAYATILNKKNFKFAFIDAFAGTGYYDSSVTKSESLFSAEIGDDERHFFEGSAHMALKIEPPFHSYIFIEKDPKRVNELRKLKSEFPDRRGIQVVNDDANDFLQKMCNKNWRRHRAVVFLDPFGMEVKWQTIVAIANTKAIDLWLLVPIGQAINRLLRKDAVISDAIQSKLDDFFGTNDWYDQFYKQQTQMTLFGQEEVVTKEANFDSISVFFIQRLQSVFAGVSTIPRKLYNSKNVPLFLLCFAAGNEKGAKTAIKIADDILRKP